MKEKLRELEKKGFKIIGSNNPFEEMRLKGPCTVILYRNGRVLVQGKEDIVSEVKTFLGLKAPKKVKKEEKPVSQGVFVGSDETLKGDTFGGLVVAGFRADEVEREKLKELGVQDSKKITDVNISLLADRIRESFPENFHVINVMPEDYNLSVSAYGLTELMNELHRQVGKELKTKKSLHIVDKYPGCKIGDVIIEKGESKYLEVAAASILARDQALKQLKQLSEKAGFLIPKGSTHVGLALDKLKNSDLDPKEFVKMRFSNVLKIFG